MLPISELATATVQALHPYLSAVAVEGAKKLGRSWSSGWTGSTTR
jgi:hypothetical protein